MSGTSADGIDAALVDWPEKPEARPFELVAFRELPYDPALVGASLLGQAWIVDPAANALGATLSAGLQVRVVAGPTPPRARILVFTWSGGVAQRPLDDVFPVVTFR